MIGSGTRVGFLGGPASLAAYVMLFNGHRSAVKNLTPLKVAALAPANLHRMDWAQNIGHIPRAWNWLVGEYPKVPLDEVKALHFTNGIPAMPGYQDCDYSGVWVKELDDMLGNPQPERMAAEWHLRLILI